MMTLSIVSVGDTVGLLDQGHRLLCRAVNVAVALFGDDYLGVLRRSASRSRRPIPSPALRSLRRSCAR